jgi:hypothetical protein
VNCWAIERFSAQGGQARLSTPDSRRNAPTWQADTCGSIIREASIRPE